MFTQINQAVSFSIQIKETSVPPSNYWFFHAVQHQHKKVYIWEIHLPFLEGAAFCNSYPVNNFIGHQVWLHIQIEKNPVFFITIIQLRKGGKEKSGTE